MSRNPLTRALAPRTSAAGRGVIHRLGRAFLLQAAFITLAAVVGVYVAGALLEEVLIRKALTDEAAYFWARRAEEPAFPLPDTRNLTTYLAPEGSDRGIPPRLRGLEPGFHEVPSAGGLQVVYADTRGGDTVYMAFEGERVSRLAMYFGLFPLAGVLVVIYLSTWLGYRISRRAVSPVIWLADEVNRLDPTAPDPEAFDPDRMGREVDDEVRSLAAAMSDFARRLNAFVERERNFTRDASHELRSPLTVMRMGAEMLLAEPALDPALRKEVARLQRSARDMEELVAAFLLLARETDSRLPADRVCLNDVVAEELERARPLVAGKPVEVDSTAACRLFVQGSDKVLSVLVGNLLRNAFSYTDAGRVAVHVGRRSVVIEDSGVGIAEPDVQAVFKPYFRANPQRRGGHGVGLTIVKRLSDRFGWPVDIASEPGVGTRVEVSFPDARCVAIQGGD